ncbi:lipoamide acyltransferase component of branched-chain alpha-keto acid dehydrogenase complex [Shouchella clausii]|nr:lipoamide acyltransferase component of branched-chain alpha-keto acid dehydrogenase complex [Shouchella clausii]
MATKMTMPQLGESVTEGTISRWLVGPGDTVQKYEPIAEVLTDKVSAEIPSSYTGTIEQLLVDENETVAVGADICTIVEEGGSEAKESNEEIKTEQKPNPATKEQTKAEPSQKSRYSPAVVRLAQEHGLDLTTIPGSGRGGRITRKDVETYVAGNHKPEPQQPPAQAKQQEPVRSTPSQAIAAHDQEIPVAGVRKAIAENMVRSKTEVPHAWTMVEVDVTNLVKLRDKKKAAFKEQEGISLTYLPFFMKACIEALKEFPEINSQWNGTTIVRKKDINLSLAVATDDALYVPVIHQADELTIKGLAKKADELAKKARTGKLTGADMQGGTFTINNTGSFGSILSQPIVNSPQAAILSVESIVKRPVVRETEEGDVIAIRHMVNLCLSLDHRVLDGLICGRFLTSLKRRLEQMNEDSTSIY